MPKFYVQSKNVSFVVTSNDAEGAVLWAMHRVIDDKVCDYEESQMLDDLDDLFGPDLDAMDSGTLLGDADPIPGMPQAVPYEPMLDGLAQFAETISVSERGFGHDEAGKFETEDIFRQWRQLMQAVDRLFDQLG